MYSVIKDNKNRNTIYNKETFFSFKDRNTEIKKNIGHSISEDVNMGIKTCIRDISSIVIQAIRRED